MKAANESGSEQVASHIESFEAFEEVFLWLEL